MILGTYVETHTHTSNIHIIVAALQKFYRTLPVAPANFSLSRTFPSSFNLNFSFALQPFLHSFLIRGESGRYLHTLL